MNHEHVSLQMHFGTFVPGVLRSVSDGIDRYLASVGKRSIESATIVITDSSDFAHQAAESNDIVVLVSPNAETVTQGIEVADPDKRAISEAVFTGCVRRFRQT
ncbi:MAG: hypothetical protein KGI49_00600 [Patescibacteria group bacterium]|nr:hypothetical protein [Patescibacteria group bacterium]